MRLRRELRPRCSAGRRGLRGGAALSRAQSDRPIYNTKPFKVSATARPRRKASTLTKLCREGVSKTLLYSIGSAGAAAGGCVSYARFVLCIIFRRQLNAHVESGCGSSRLPARRTLVTFDYPP
ncbi:hypothetical protein EVAR_9811_1 [Eumeta japonica]|uniref:Uncharacterized protein n=1 Tax=Eumeta variegata TaxID=151549 RepID=A0A4C1U720_EUMVA|nr:hypothetical protein EVAR_9811_1 [Eumeta japonica]